MNPDSKKLSQLDTKDQFSPLSNDLISKLEEREDKDSDFLASQWKIIWRKFSKHKLAMMAMYSLGLLYLTAIFCEFLSPYGPLERFRKYRNAPPQLVRIYDKNLGFHRPFVYGTIKERDSKTFLTRFKVDKTQIYPICFFCRGDSYKLWGLFESNLHFFGTEESSIFLLGTDRLGRDLFTRVLYGSRISLSVGLMGIAITFFIGIILGGLSGYLGGWVDSVIQRTIDLLISIPIIPLWMALAAALPRDWSPLRIYFGIVVIFSIIGWTELARVVRGKLLAVREEDFVVAARIMGSGHLRIIIKHLIPSFSSYIIVSLTLAIPKMILGETALSFLGLGLQPPVVSWGTLLKDAQSLQAVAHHPWLLTPCLFVIIAVLMYNFIGDGLRDSADPMR